MDITKQVFYIIFLNLIIFPNSVKEPQNVRFLKT